MLFSSALAEIKMKTDLSKIWTLTSNSAASDNNYYDKWVFFTEKYVKKIHKFLHELIRG